MPEPESAPSPRPRGGSEHVAAPLFRHLGPGHFSFVAEWLRDVASTHALERDTGQVISPTVTWLAEAVSFYDPEEER